MYNLIGEFEEVYQESIGGSFKIHNYTDIVATFDDKKDAEKYIEKSKLKNSVTQSFAPKKVFKSKSLLRNCVDAYIEEYKNLTLPHNPKI